MLDIGWTELLAIAMLTIIVVGPKDLPKVLRTVGKWTAKARSITREFQNSLDDMARETELDEIKQEIESSTYNSIGKLDDIVDPTGTAERLFDMPETESSDTEADPTAAPGEGEAAVSDVAEISDGGAAPESISPDLPDQPAEEEPQRQVGS